MGRARKAITERMKVDCLLWHASLTPFPIRCGICREPIIPMERERGLEWDHIVALALDGDHIYCNLRPLHKACHAIKTRGTKATTAGSDIHRIAKVKRITGETGTRAEKFIPQKRPLDEPREPKPRYGNTTFRSTPR